MTQVTGRRGTGFISAEEVDNMVPDEAQNVCTAVCVCFFEQTGQG